MAGVPPLIPEPFDRPAHEKAVGAALMRPETRVFFDTSALIWLYGLHAAARAEVLEWMINGLQAGNVHIPRWAAHEFSRHRRNHQVLLPIKQQIGGLTALLEQLKRWAHLVTDDASAVHHGFTSRAAYLREVDDARKAVARVLKHVTGHGSLTQIEAELLPVFNNLALDGDIHAGLAGLRAEYEARAEIRVPPGYEDKVKGRKARADTPEDDEEEDGSAPTPPLAGANRFGDFAIWTEILSFCANLSEAERGPVIIITHDVKPDWSYTPQQILDHDGRIRPNLKTPLRATTAQPLLAHEARVRAGIAELYIISTPQLAWIATHERLPLALGELAAAVQIEDGSPPPGGESAEEPGDDAAQGAGAEEAPDAPPEAVAEPAEAPARDLGAGFLEAPPQQALADRVYSRDPQGSPEMDKVIARLKSSNWYTQNPASGEGLEELRGGKASPLQAFIFGRNLYQAACGSASTPIGILEDLGDDLAAVPDHMANVVYAGALFEAYFNKDGELRPRPKSERITALFKHQDHPRFRPSVAWLQERLAEHRAKFLVLPSPERPIRRLNVTRDDGGGITLIDADGAPLTEPYVDGLPLGDPLPPAISLDRLRKAISRHFALPDDQFTIGPSWEGAIPVRALQLRDWGPRTTVTFAPPRV